MAEMGVQLPPSPVEKADTLTDYLSDSRGWVIGSDEVGTGALAGPVVVAACLVPKRWNLDGLRDSKKYTTGKTRVSHALAMSKDDQVFTSFEWISVEEIEEIGLALAVRYAHMRAVNTCLARCSNALVVVDGLHIQLAVPHLSIAKADDLIPACSAASVRAKVDRDTYMHGVDKDYPQYGFAEHKGYGTQQHYQMLQKFGVCPEHRRGTLKKFLTTGKIPMKHPGSSLGKIADVPRLASVIRRLRVG